MWEKRDLLKGLITQNIDGLHQDAGSETVSEIHGTARWVNCQSCSWKEKAGIHVEQFVETGEVPSCPECNGLVKHSTISFGQSLDPAVMAQSNTWSQRADFYLAMGSSLVVQPAASLPVIAKESGSRLVIINRDPTPLDNLADLVIHEPLGETLKKVEEAILNSDKA
jgi:NAD-dependent protein deacetylase/lipoamidase